MMHTALVGIGSNQGDRFSHCQQVLRMLSASASTTVTRVSRWYESEAWGTVGPIAQPPYLNGAAELATALSAEGLLALLEEIERAFGRPRVRQKGEPRTIDLDILFYDTLSLNLPGLTIPHPELSKRLFVLLPLCDIAPGLVHPVMGLSIRDLTARCQTTGPAGWMRRWNDTEESA